MEAVMLHHNRKLDRQFTSPPSEFFYPTFPFSSSFNGGAVPYTPPFSFQGPSPPINPRAHQYYHHQQPPLLPLPNIPNPYQNNNRRINNKLTRHQSLSVKKSNFSGAGPKREKTKPNVTSTKALPDSGIVLSGTRLGPEPKDVPRVLFSGNSNTFNQETKNIVSPPPSSLPLPTFSIRPKRSCNSKAVAVVDTGATDSLRRFLRLP
ncbi:hypothetical protein POM88_046762 [Heracleum sosnowskyi]|uniref:Uncharacterized protein n=1 Tax=Heracleum sosnowskyi TaxID=360622 RepID=A0AAD8H9A6_9APIA|nr:hypothetical protein POM88_046762 [Heracleum sosnowskyi]